jgi:predicted RNase H-like HicB family nuclease
MGLTPFLLPIFCRGVVMSRQFTAIIEREDEGYIALCPELDIASEGSTVSEARANLAEAIELFMETASVEEKSRRLSAEVYVTQLEVAGA